MVIKFEKECFFLDLRLMNTYYGLQSSKSDLMASGRFFWFGVFLPV